MNAPGRKSASELPRWKTSNNSIFCETGRKILKLSLFFIAMDLLIVLAYPIVYVHGKLRQFTKAKGTVTLPNSLVVSSITTGG